MSDQLADIALASINTAGGTQSRVELSEAAVASYADAMASGETLPPIVVFHDGSTYWLADGFHRVMAATRAGSEWLTAEVRRGTKRDAILYSVGANSTHGLQRTNADKRRSVEMLLADEEWASWNDSEIARRCAVSRDLVHRCRPSLAESASEKPPTKYTNKHGTESVMHTQNIGSSKGLRAGTKSAEDRAKEIDELAITGLRSIEIADRLGLSQDRVRKVASEFGIPLVDAQIRAKGIVDRQVVEQTVLKLEAAAQSLKTIKFTFRGITAEEARDWSESLAESLKIYRQFHKQLNEVANGK